MTAFEEAMRVRKERIIAEAKAQNELVDFVNTTIRKLRDDVVGHGGAVQIMINPAFTNGHVLAGIVVKFPPAAQLEDAHVNLVLSRTDQIDSQIRYELRANDHRADVKTHEQAVGMIYGALKM